ncbi:MAG TPA: formate dehydrogenase [Albitalea sp.]
MKSSGVDRTQQDAPSAPSTKRRGLLLGAGVAGAAAIAARALPTAPAEDVAAPAAKPAPDTKAGYRLTQHVLRYYETTKV